MKISKEDSEMIEKIQSEIMNFSMTNGKIILSVDQSNLICRLITEEDKGMRNWISDLMMSCENPDIPQKIVPLISSQDISLRNLVGDILTKIGEKSIQALLDYSDGVGNDDKKFIIDILGGIGSLKAEDKILKVLQTAEDDNVILSCIEALGNIKSEKSLNELINVYSKNNLYNAAVIDALGKIGSQTVLGFVLTKYKDDDELVKFSVIECLGQIGDEDTFFFLLSELNETNGPLNRPLIKAVYLLKEKFSFDIPFDARMRNTIIQIITDSDIEYKRIAVKLLSAFNDREILSLYLKIAGDDQETDEIIRLKIAESYELFFEIIGIHLSQNPSNLKILLEILKDIVKSGEYDYRSIMTEVIQRSITDALCQLIYDYDEEVRMLSFELLFILDPQTAILFADDLSEDQCYWNRMRLIEILEESEIVQVNPVLEKLMKDPEEMISLMAKECITRRLNKWTV